MCRFVWQRGDTSTWPQSWAKMLDPKPSHPQFGYTCRWDYPLVNHGKTIRKLWFIWKFSMFKCLIVKSSINRSFSIAMRNCQRVSSRIIQQANTRVTRHLQPQADAALATCAWLCVVAKRAGWCLGLLVGWELKHTLFAVIYIYKLWCVYIYI